MNRSALGIVFALAIAWDISCPNNAIAGTTGVISGHVYDVWENYPGIDDQSLSGATVILSSLRDRSEEGNWWNLDTRTHATAIRITDKKGAFLYISLEPGYYVIRVVDGGKHPGCPRRVRVDVDQTTFVSLDVFDIPVLMHCATGDFRPISEPFSPP
jgi:hypothetical protein